MALSIPAKNIDETLIDAIQSMQDPDLRNFMVNMALPRLIDSGYIEAVDQLLGHVYSEKQLPVQQSRLAAKWARTDPIAAAGYSERISSNTQRQIAFASIIQIWAVNDMNGANEWLKQRSSFENVEHLAAKLATQASSKEANLSVSLQWLSRIKDQRLKQETAQHVYKNWASYEYQAALEHLALMDSLPNTQKNKISAVLKKHITNNH